MHLLLRKSLQENDLIAGCKKRNPKAQRMLYEKHAPRMLGLCQRYVYDRQEAEGIMSSGFIIIFEKITQFQGEGSFEGWMKRIMINEALGYLRRNKALYLETTLEKAAREPDLDALETKLEAEDLLKMIDTLPTGYRAVFNLFAIEGYSHKEIAGMMGISENTSKSQLSRARAQLQGKLLQAEKALKDKTISHEK